MEVLERDDAGRVYRVQVVSVELGVERWLMRPWDSFDTDGSVASMTPHSAFVDPATPKDAPRRESIELRAIVLY